MSQNAAKVGFFFLNDKYLGLNFICQSQKVFIPLSKQKLISSGKMAPQKIVLYYPFKANERLRYIASHLLTEILGTEVSITDNRSVFLDYPGLAINYSNKNLAHGIHIYPEGLLEETGIHAREIIMSEWKGFPCFFTQKEGDLPFDIFAASFYLLSRYEEYTTSNVDEHGRFDPEESLAYKYHFLEIPLIDRWAYLLKDELSKKYPNTTFSPRNFRFISTFDIDHPYQIKKRGIVRTLGALGKDALRLNFKLVGERLSVLLRLKGDPYMKAIRWIDQWHKTADKEYSLFILGDVDGKYGRHTNLPLTDYYRFLRELKSVTLGLHPSYDTYKNLELLTKEKYDLEKLLERKITTSRNHFLRISIPETFQEISLVGIEDDFSLIYAKLPGFRSSTCIPHRFYDLEQDKITDLFLHSTIMMDSTFLFQQKLTPENALKKIKFLIDACFQSGGDYVSLWHNSNLAGNSKNNPWIGVFCESFKYASALQKNN